MLDQQFDRCADVGVMAVNPITQADDDVILCDSYHGGSISLILIDGAYRPVALALTPALHRRSRRGRMPAGGTRDRLGLYAGRLAVTAD